MRVFSPKLLLLMFRGVKKFLGVEKKQEKGEKQDGSLSSESENSTLTHQSEQTCYGRPRFDIIFISFHFLGILKDCKAYGNYVTCHT